MKISNYTLPLILLVVNINVMAQSYMQFTAPTDRIDVGDLTPMSGEPRFTFEAQIRVKTWTPGAVIFGKRTGSESKQVFLSMGNQVGDLVASVSGGQYRLAEFKNAIPNLDTWYDVALRFDRNEVLASKRLYVFVDGEVVPRTYGQDMDYVTFPTGSTHCYLGDNGGHYDLDDVRVWKTTVSQANIKRFLGKDLWLHPDTKSLVLNYTFDEPNVPVDISAIFGPFHGKVEDYNYTVPEEGADYYVSSTYVGRNNEILYDDMPAGSLVGYENINIIGNWTATHDQRFVSQYGEYNGHPKSPSYDALSEVIDKTDAIGDLQRSGQVLHFNGWSSPGLSGVNLADIWNYNFAAKMGFDAMIYVEEFKAGDIIFRKKGSNGSEVFLGFIDNEDQKDQFYFGVKDIEGGTQQVIRFGNKIQKNKWTHIALSYKDFVNQSLPDNGVELYINGVKCNDLNDFQHGTGLGNMEGGSMELGNAWKGYMDDIRFWWNPLTEAQAIYLANETSEYGRSVMKGRSTDELREYGIPSTQESSTIPHLKYLLADYPITSEDKLSSSEPLGGTIHDHATTGIILSRLKELVLEAEALEGWKGKKKIILSFGDAPDGPKRYNSGNNNWDRDLNLFASNATLIANFGENVANYIVANGLDGVDIDWENYDWGANNSKWDGYSNLVNAIDLNLKTIDPNKDYFLSSTLANNIASADRVLTDEAFANLDVIQVMTYDIGYPCGPGVNVKPASLSALICQTNDLISWGYPKEKMVPAWSTHNSIHNSNINTASEVQSKIEYVMGEGFAGIFSWLNDNEELNSIHNTYLPAYWTEDRPIFKSTRLEAVSVSQTIEESNSGLRLYPNPVKSNGVVNMDIQSELPQDKLLMTLTNLSGQQVYDRKADLIEGVNHLQIPTESLPSGLYILNLKSTGINTSSKILIGN